MCERKICAGGMGGIGHLSKNVHFILIDKKVVDGLHSTM